VSGILARSVRGWRAANDRFEVGRGPGLAEAGGGRPPQLPLRPRRIIAAVDFTPAGERAREVAVRLARASDAVLDRVHVLDAFDHIFVRRQPELLAEPEAVLDGIDAALASRARAAQQRGVRCVWTSLVGAPGLELGRHATRTRADLLVVGAAAASEEQPAAWGARALEQLLSIPGWRGVVLRVPGEARPRHAQSAQSTSADFISGIQRPVKPSIV